MENHKIHTASEHTQTGMRELLFLLMPIFAILSMAAGVGFFERICLSRYSLESLEGAVQAVYILQIFQLPLVSFANMAHTFIGKYLGSGEPHEAGSCIWQIGWISLFSMVLTLPLGFLARALFLKSSQEVSVYFTTLLGINFLFALGAALSSFYLAQKKTYFIISTHLTVALLTLISAPALIFGIPNLIPSFGVLGAALSIVVGRLVFCGILLYDFLRSPALEIYRTDRWKVDFSKIRHYLQIGMPRALGRSLTMLVWVVTSHFMTRKGGDYLVVLSIGGTVVLFCYFFSESLIQSLTLIFSRYLGSQQYKEIIKSWRAGLFFVVILSGCLSIPLIIFPDFVLSFFFVELPLGHLREYLRLTLLWVWGWVFFSTLAGLFLSFLLAMQDTFYYMTVMSLTVLTSALPVYFFIYHLAWSPDKFWLIMMTEYFIVFCLYSMRAYWLGRKLMSESLKT